jgi:hypothetical protein
MLWTTHPLHKPVIAHEKFVINPKDNAGEAFVDIFQRFLSLPMVVVMM